MIDIHTHILPGIDDGAQSLEDALAMARLAADDGATVLFATPHIMSHGELSRCHTIQNRSEELRTVLTAAGIVIALESGAEVFPFPELLDAVDAGLPVFLGPSRRYILLDLPQTDLPHGLEALTFQLLARGITPILAHPERAMTIQQQPQRLEAFVQRGVLLQVTAGSVLGLHGPRARQTAEVLLRHDWVHFIASDAHSPHHRPPGLADAATRVREMCSSETAEALTTTNGRRLLQGETIPSSPQRYRHSPGNPLWAMLRRAFRR